MMKAGVSLSRKEPPSQRSGEQKGDRQGHMWKRDTRSCLNRCSLWMDGWKKRVESIVYSFIPALADKAECAAELSLGDGFTRQAR